MTTGAAMWWKNVCLYLDSINVLRHGNGKINLKEEQTLVVKEVLFGSSGLPQMFLLFSFPTGHLARVSQAF